MGKKRKTPMLPREIETSTSFMYPSLHQDLLDALADTIDPPTFYEYDHQGQRQHRTHVMGTFTCSDPTCATRRWSSKKVAIQIRLYSANRYNARVFNQRCRRCEQLGTLTLDQESYIDRVAYRLKKWAGVPVEPPPYTAKKGQPHKRDLCEGCKVGLCQESDD